MAADLVLINVVDGGTQDRPMVQIGAIVEAMDASESTKAQYRRELRYFIEWLGTRPLHINVLIEWKNTLRQRSDLSTGTKAKYLSSARTLLRELHRLNIIPVDLSKSAKGFKVSRAHKRPPISECDIKNVLTFLTSPAKDDARPRVILGLMLLQGLRRIEIARLDVEDFDRTARTLRVLGKGCDDYETVDLHPRMVEILIDYIDRKNLRSGALFPSPKKPGSRLSSNAIWRIGMATNKRLGISEGINLHGYRKAFTTCLIRTGMPLLDVQGYTRHKTISMLQIYYQKLERAKTLPTYYAAFAE